MSIYRFSASSPIREASFHHANDHPPVALLMAADGTTADQLWTMRQNMGEAGWICVPVTVGNKEMLQVSGFEKEQQFLNFMQAQHFTQGTPIVTAEATDNPKLSTKEWFQNTSQKICGWNYIIGDIALMMSGLMSGRSKETLSGFLSTGAGGIMARYGNVKTEHHVREISERTAEFIKKQSGNLPENCTLAAILKDRRSGVIHNLEGFLTRYPMQVSLGICGMSSLSMLQSGIKHGKFVDVAYGAYTGALTSGVLLLPEKKDWEEKENPKAEASGSLISQWWNWVSEKPLRMAGYAYMVGGALLGLSAYREFKTNPQQKSYIFKFISAANYLMGDLMIAISSKEHVNADGKFDADEQRRIEAMVAEAIVRQPKDLQEALVHHVASFLATQPELNGKAIDIAKSITGQLQHMDHNPWAARAETQTPVVPLR